MTFYINETERNLIKEALKNNNIIVDKGTISINMTERKITYWIKVCTKGHLRYFNKENAQIRVEKKLKGRSLWNFKVVIE